MTLSPDARRRAVFSVTSTLYFNKTRTYKTHFSGRFLRVDGTDFEKFMIDHLQELIVDEPDRRQVMEILKLIFDDLPSTHQAKIIGLAKRKDPVEYCLAHPFDLIYEPETQKGIA